MRSTTIKVADSARDLGVIRDAELTMSARIAALHSVDPDSFNSDSYVHSSGHSLYGSCQDTGSGVHILPSGLWTTAIRFCME